MEMVGHDNIFVCLNYREFIGQLPPPGFYHQSGVIQLHPIPNYLTEHASPALCANCNKIPALL
jgi:hypothetical protein